MVYDLGMFSEHDEKAERTYKGVTIRRLLPSGYWEYYSYIRGSFVMADTLFGIKSEITKDVEKIKKSKEI